MLLHGHRASRVSTRSEPAVPTSHSRTGTKTLRSGRWWQTADAPEGGVCEDIADIELAAVRLDRVLRLDDAIVRDDARSDLYTTL